MPETNNILGWDISNYHFHLCMHPVSWFSAFSFFFFFLQNTPWSFHKAAYKYHDFLQPAPHNLQVIQSFDQIYAPCSPILIMICWEPVFMILWRFSLHYINGVNFGELEIYGPHAPMMDQNLSSLLWKVTLCTKSMKTPASFCSVILNDSIVVKWHAPCTSLALIFWCRHMIMLRPSYTPAICHYNCFKLRTTCAKRTLYKAEDCSNLNCSTITQKEVRVLIYHKVSIGM